VTFVTPESGVSARCPTRRNDRADFEIALINNARAAGGVIHEQRWLLDHIVGLSTIQADFGGFLDDQSHIYRRSLTATLNA